MDDIGVFGDLGVLDLVDCALPVPVGFELGCVYVWAGDGELCYLFPVFHYFLYQLIIMLGV